MMNDFTKEELKKLRDCLNYAVGNPYGPTADSVMPLDEKIQSMIDNYCENDFQPVIGKFQIESCHKCMRLK